MSSGYHIPVFPVVDVHVGEDHGVHGVAQEGPLQVGGVPALLG